MTTKTVFVVLERTPLFFLEEEMQNLTDGEVEISQEFYESYLQIENDFRVLQEALFNMYLETQLAAQDANPFVPETDDDDDEDLLNPVHDSRTLYWNISCFLIVR